MAFVLNRKTWLPTVAAAVSLLLGQSAAWGQNAFLLPAEGLPELPPLPPKRLAKTHIFLIPGYLISMSPGVASHTYSNGRGGTYTQDSATGHGMELSLSVVPARSSYAYGAFAQAQRFFSFNGNHSRYAAGMQASWYIWGGEAGFAYRGADDFRRSTPQALLGTYISLVFFNIGVQVGIPLVGERDGIPAHALEGSVLFGFKLPIPL